MLPNSKDEDFSPLKAFKRRCRGGWQQLPRRPVLTFWEDSIMGWSTRVASQVAICKGTGSFAHSFEGLFWGESLCSAITHLKESGGEWHWFVTRGVGTAASLSPRFLLGLPSDTLGLKTPVFCWYLHGTCMGQCNCLQIPGAYLRSQWLEAHSKCSLKWLTWPHAPLPGLLGDLHLSIRPSILCSLHESLWEAWGTPELWIRKNKTEVHFFLVEQKSRSLFQGFANVSTRLLIIKEGEVGP